MIKRQIRAKIKLNPRVLIDEKGSHYKVKRTGSVISVEITTIREFTVTNHSLSFISSLYSLPPLTFPAIYLYVYGCMLWDMWGLFVGLNKHFSLMVRLLCWYYLVIWHFQNFHEGSAWLCAFIVAYSIFTYKIMSNVLFFLKKKKKFVIYHNLLMLLKPKRKNILSFAEFLTVATCDLWKMVAMLLHVWI